MRLKTDTVQGYSAVDQVGGDGGVGEGLVVDGFDVVVVDAEFDIGGGGVGVVELEGGWRGSESSIRMSWGN